jgi:two-component system sensor histidine kinase ChiS
LREKIPASLQRICPDFKPVKIRVGIIAVLILLTGVMGCASSVQSPRAVGGVLDLTTWDVATRGPIRLDGEWEFVWGELHDSRAMTSSDQRESDFLALPGMWQGKTDAGETLSAQGQGTYRLRVRLPASLATRSPAPTMSLLVSGMLSVCEVRVNRTIVASSGKPGLDQASEKPVSHILMPRFRITDRDLEIVLHVSNHHNVRGGINSSIFLGTGEQIQTMIDVRRFSGAFMSGALLIMALYHLALFSRRRSETANLYFGLFCFFWGVATLFSPSSGFLMSFIAPGLPWGWYINLSLLPFGLTIPLLVIFYHVLFPKKYGRIVNRAAVFLGAVYVVYILLTPPNAYGLGPFLYFWMTRAVYGYLFAVFALDLLHREKNALMLIPGYLALALSELDMMVFDLNITHTTPFAPYGVFIFILSYSFYISATFADAFSRVEKLSDNLEAANLRLVDMNNLKDEFLANTTHELKTPLAGIVSIAETLLAGAGGRLSKETREHLKLLAHSGKRLAGLVDEILDFSRLTHRDIALNTSAVSLYDAAQGVLDITRSMAADKNLELIDGVEPDLPPVQADPERLEQILFNLVGNAIKYTESGSITVCARNSGEFTRVSVADTGIGIPYAARRRIFNSYEQLSAAENRATGGAGLGLAITRHLVDLHGGSIDVDSRPGQGSVFSFTLPRNRLPEAMHARQETDDSKIRQLNPILLPEPEPAAADLGCANGRTYQVLIVDDEPVNLHVIASCLRLRGITFKTASRGSRALDLIRDGDRPDMLILDVMMPGANGYEVCKILRREHSAQTLPVIMLTVKNRVEDILAGFSAGANDYLTKPFSREELLARVDTLLRLKQAYAVLKENVCLKQELVLRRETEQDLWLMQHRLSGMLDSLGDAVLAVNLSREIAFCNTAFETLAARTAKDLLGRPLDDFLPEQGAAHGTVSGGLSAFLSDTRPVGEQPTHIEDLVVLESGGQDVYCHVLGTRLEMEEETLFVMVFRRREEGEERIEPGHEQTSAALVSVFHELNAQRRIFQEHEDALAVGDHGSGAPEIFSEGLKNVRSLMERFSDGLSAIDKRPDKRRLAVLVMNLAVECWVQVSGETKADLAKTSRIWNVYMEKDGYLRTQTLDKYLSEKTLPARPRWLKIHATAEFVLAACTKNVPVRTELRKRLGELKALA